MKYYCVMMLFVFASALNAQKHKKSHKKPADIVILKKDSVKPDTMTRKPIQIAVKKEDESWLTGGSIIVIIGCLTVLLILFLRANAVRNRKKEEERKERMRLEIEHALKTNEIWRSQYNTLIVDLYSLDQYKISMALNEAKTKKGRSDYLLSKYTEEEVIRILKHEYWIGMTEEQLIDCKGKPDKIELEQLKTKTKRIFVYGNKSSGDIFNFVDGKLERFKDR
jgi:hypothetical protein